jgi:DNA adenine methylase
MSKSKLIIEETMVKDVKSNVNIPKPIIKWVGGKTQIIEKVISEFPIEIDNYHEIFLGGGSVLFALLAYVKSGVVKIKNKIYAYDLNETLINMYKNIQSNYNELFDTLQIIIKEYNECDNQEEINRKPQNINEAKESQENYFYWIRSKYNTLSNEDKNKPIGSAYFIFMNKTCFRGVYRVGPNGFNVPFGNYKNPEIINYEHLKLIHDLIQDVTFKCCDFNESLQNINANDFVYLDPPYAPETTTSFVDYTEKGFAIEDHNKLFTKINEFNTLEKKFLLSNSDVKLVRDNFTHPKIKIESIACKRSINSKKPGSKTQEVLIKNY